MILFKRILLIPTLAFAPFASAHESEKLSRALHFDQPIAKEMAIDFQIEEDLYPNRSSFELLDFAFLSNEAGERWALVVVRNTVHEFRSFSANQIIGFFASGNYRNPVSLNKRIEGKKTETFMIPFGKSDMPLVKLMTRSF